MTKEECVNKAKNILMNVTPTELDCGKACGKSCCQGDESTGMLLFPGEKTSFRVKNGVAVCDGGCDRETRPLSCMIFPLFPYPVKRGLIYKITAAADPRAVRLCPLLKTDEITDKFRVSVEEAGKILMKSEETRKFLLDTADFLLEIARL